MRRVSAQSDRAAVAAQLLLEGPVAAALHATKEYLGDTVVFVKAPSPIQLPLFGEGRPVCLPTVGFLEELVGESCLLIEVQLWGRGPTGAAGRNVYKYAPHEYSVWSVEWDMPSFEHVMWYRGFSFWEEAKRSRRIFLAIQAGLRGEEGPYSGWVGEVKIGP